MNKKLQHLPCPSLDKFQHLCAELRGPELDTALQTWPHSAKYRAMLPSLLLLAKYRGLLPFLAPAGQVQSHNTFPGAAGHAVSDPAGCQWLSCPPGLAPDHLTPAQVQPLITSTPQCFSTEEISSPQSVELHGVIVAKM